MIEMETTEDEWLNLARQLYSFLERAKRDRDRLLAPLADEPDDKRDREDEARKTKGDKGVIGAMATIGLWDHALRSHIVEEINAAGRQTTSTPISSLIKWGWIREEGGEDDKIVSFTEKGRGIYEERFGDENNWVALHRRLKLKKLMARED